MPEDLPDPAALLDLDLPPEVLPGVIANWRLLAEHFRNLEGFAVPDAS